MAGRLMTVGLLDRADLAMPYVEKGMAVGLFGGSFNPPHAGHALVAEIALRRLDLDRLWWMVTPGNPLKAGAKSLSLAERVELSRRIAKNPRIDVTAFEAAHRVRYTADTLALVKARNPGVDFVWIMGADSLRDFHRWQRWRLHRNDLPDRGHRPTRRDAGVPVFGDGQDLRLRPGRRSGRVPAGAYEGSGVDLHPRAALVAVVDRAARGLGALIRRCRDLA